MTKIKREQSELITALEKHLGLLNEYYDRAFNKGEKDFYGEIACKIRLLAIKTGSNIPLLIKLQNVTGKNIKYPFDKPWGKNELTLCEYMNSFGCAIRNSNDELVAFSKKDVLAIYSQQVGGCHEDWKISDELHKMINSGIEIYGNPPLVELLRAVCRTILIIGNDFLNEIKK